MGASASRSDGAVCHARRDSRKQLVLSAMERGWHGSSAVSVSASPSTPQAVPSRSMLRLPAPLFGQDDDLLDPASGTVSALAVNQPRLSLRRRRPTDPPAAADNAAHDLPALQRLTMTPRASSAGCAVVTLPLSLPGTRRSSGEAQASRLHAFAAPASAQASLERVDSAPLPSQPMAAVSTPPASGVVVQEMVSATAVGVSSQRGTIAAPAPLLHSRMLQRRGAPMRCGSRAPGPSRLGMVVA